MARENQISTHNTQHTIKNEYNKYGIRNITLCERAEFYPELSFVIYCVVLYCICLFVCLLSSSNKIETFSRLSKHLSDITVVSNKTNTNQPASQPRNNGKLDEVNTTNTSRLKWTWYLKVMLIVCVWNPKESDLLSMISVNRIVYDTYFCNDSCFGKV